MQYLKPETEASPDTEPEVLAKMPAEWPEQGAISVAKLTMRYRPEMPLVLKGLSFEIKGGEKVRASAAVKQRQDGISILKPGWERELVPQHRHWRPFG